MTAAGALGALGTFIGLVRALPQLARLLRVRDTHGVSLDTAATSSIVSFGWVTYGVLTDQPAVVLATGASGVVFALVTVFALRFGRRISEWRAAPLWLVVLVIFGAAGGASGLGLILPLSVLVANLPQLLVAYRERNLTGLSLPTWLLSMSDGAVWLAYSLVTGDRAILVFGILQLTTSAAIVIRRWRWGRVGSEEALDLR
ncbi:MAG: PQ-loop domain-containing transporter [Actinomycetota bacterium]